MEIPHELIHALDLEHTFDSEEVHHFTKGATKNYMDYDNSKEYTFKWQWEKMRTSKWIITPLLFLLFVLSACSSYKNINCNYEYRIREEEKKVDTLSPDFKWETEKKVNNDIVWYGRPPILSEVFTKHIKKDTLGIVMKTLIEYDLEGKISTLSSFIPYEIIGREFIFDEQGNIKEVINHDEGWKICAFQALAIAKRYAGNNYHKEEPLWRVYRDEYKGKKAWLAMYKNRRYKWVYLYINRDTGSIMKRSNKEIRK